MRPIRLTLVSAAAVLLCALASTALAAAPLYDPWAWLVWGREAIGLGLDTAGGPSWKPLPVLATAALVPLGKVAPEAWLVLARAGWIAAVILAGVLAARIAAGIAGEMGERPGRPALAVAAGVGSAGAVLLHDPVTPWVRQAAGGLSEPLLTALVLGAALAALEGRRVGAMLLLGAGALLRPEVWPLLAGYALWAGGRDAAGRRLLALGGVLALLVGGLWFGPELLATGDPLTGAGIARGSPGDPPLGEAAEALGWGLALPLAALWPLAGLCVLAGWRAGVRFPAAMAGAALAWFGIVAAMSALGYAGLPRFSAGAAGLVCALGGAGAGLCVRRALSPATDPPTRNGSARAALPAARAALVGGLAVALLLQGGWRAAELEGQIHGMAAFAGELAELERLVREVGEERLTGCGPVAITDLEFETALAWRLERPLSAVDVVAASWPEDGVLVVGESGGGGAAPGGRFLGSAGRWSARAVGCS